MAVASAKQFMHCLMVNQLACSNSRGIDLQDYHVQHVLTVCCRHLDRARGDCLTPAWDFLIALLCGMTVVHRFFLGIGKAPTSTQAPFFKAGGVSCRIDASGVPCRTRIDVSRGTGRMITYTRLAQILLAASGWICFLFV